VHPPAAGDLQPAKPSAQAAAVRCKLALALAEQVEVEGDPAEVVVIKGRQPCADLGGEHQRTPSHTGNGIYLFWYGKQPAMDITSSHARQGQPTNCVLRMSRTSAASRQPSSSPKGLDVRATPEDRAQKRSPGAPAAAEPRLPDPGRPARAAAATPSRPDSGVVAFGW